MVNILNNVFLYSLSPKFALVNDITPMHLAHFFFKCLGVTPDPPPPPPPFCIGFTPSVLQCYVKGTAPLPPLLEILTLSCHAQASSVLQV